MILLYSDNYSRVSRHGRIPRYIVRNHASGADKGILAYGDIRQDGRSRSDGGASFHQGGFNMPICFSLKHPVGCGGAGIGIIREGNVMADEDVIFDGNAFADEGMT